MSTAANLHNEFIPPTIVAYTYAQTNCRGTAGNMIMSGMRIQL